jgi:hypothetical protein
VEKMSYHHLQLLFDFSIVLDTVKKEIKHKDIDRIKPLMLSHNKILNELKRNFLNLKFEELNLKNIFEENENNNLIKKLKCKINNKKIGDFVFTTYLPNGPLVLFYINELKRERKFHLYLATSNDLGIDFYKIFEKQNKELILEIKNFLLNNQYQAFKGFLTSENPNYSFANTIFKILNSKELLNPCFHIFSLMKNDKWFNTDELLTFPKYQSKIEDNKNKLKIYTNGIEMNPCIAKVKDWSVSLIEKDNISIKIVAKTKTSSHKFYFTNLSIPIFYLRKNIDLYIQNLNDTFEFYTDNYYMEDLLFIYFSKQTILSLFKNLTGLPLKNILVLNNTFIKKSDIFKYICQLNNSKITDIEPNGQNLFNLINIPISQILEKVNEFKNINLLESEFSNLEYVGSDEYKKLYIDIYKEFIKLKIKLLNSNRDYLLEKLHVNKKIV